MGVFINMVSAFGAVATNLWVLWLWRGRPNFAVRVVCYCRTMLALPYAVSYAMQLGGIVDAVERARIGLVLGGPSGWLVWLLPPLLIRPPGQEPAAIAEKVTEMTLRHLDEAGKK